MLQNVQPRLPGHGIWLPRRPMAAPLNDFLVVFCSPWQRLAVNSKAKSPSRGERRKRIPKVLGR